MRGYESKISGNPILDHFPHDDCTIRGGCYISGGSAYGSIFEDSIHVVNSTFYKSAVSHATHLVNVAAWRCTFRDSVSMDNATWLGDASALSLILCVFEGDVDLRWSQNVLLMLKEVHWWTDIP